VIDRFESTGKVTKMAAEAIGLVGPAARACDCMRDVVRTIPRQLPLTHIPVFTYDTAMYSHGRMCGGRRCRLRLTLSFRNCRSGRPESGRSVFKLFIRTDSGGRMLTVSLVEGWRGEICHVAITDEQADSAGIKLPTPRFTTGSASPLRCADSRYPIFRSATRVSTFPIAVTICNGGLRQHHVRHTQDKNRPETPDGPLPENRSCSPRPFQGLPVWTDPDRQRGCGGMREGMPGGRNHHNAVAPHARSWQMHLLRRMRNSLLR